MFRPAPLGDVGERQAAFRRQRLTWPPTAGRRRSSTVMFALRKTSIDSGQYVRVWLCLQQSLLDQSQLVKPSGGPAMNIAIIGAGNVGRALATAFTRAGHTVADHLARPGDAGAVATRHGRAVARSPTGSRRRRATSSFSPSRSPAPEDVADGDPRGRSRASRRRRHQPDVVRRRPARRSTPAHRMPSASRPGCRTRRGQGIQHVVRLQPGRPDRRRHPARRLRRRVTMPRPRRPCSSSSPRSVSARSTRARSSRAAARAARVPEHRPQRHQRLELAEWLEAGGRTGVGPADAA